MASQASVELHTLIYFKKRPTDTDAKILKIRTNGFIAFVSKYGIEGPVYLISRGQKRGGDWNVDEQQQKIRKTNGEVSYDVLQPVKIHMEVVEPQPNRPKLELTLFLLGHEFSCTMTMYQRIHTYYLNIWIVNE